MPNHQVPLTVLTRLWFSQEPVQGSKVFVASGYCDEKTKEEIADLGAATFLDKPFDTAELLRTVREVLDSTA